MSGLVCALMIFFPYDAHVDVEMFSSHEQALQEAIYYASEEYERNFTTIEDIRDYQNLLIDQGVDGIGEIYIKCNHIKY